MDEKKDRDKIRMASRGRGRIEIAGLTEEEMDNIEGMIHNHFFVTTNDEGRLETIRRREKLPSPIEDDELLPFWRPIAGGHAQLELFKVPFPKHSPPTIIIQHLCGYFYTPENYQIQADRLESYGFHCLRSQRGANGRFYESWILPSLWHSKGDLEMALAKKRDSKKAIQFLCRNVSFGTLDVAIQRAAMPMPD